LQNGKMLYFKELQNAVKYRGKGVLL